MLKQQKRIGMAAPTNKVKGKPSPIKNKLLKPVNKFTAPKHSTEKVEPSKKVESSKKVGNKIYDEAYDRGFNDGYAKGLEDGALDERQ